MYSKISFTFMFFPHTWDQQAPISTELLTSNPGKSHSLHLLSLIIDFIVLTDASSINTAFNNKNQFYF